MPDVGPLEIVLILLVLILLFGAKKLPDLARSTGRSLRIFKAETKGLMDDDDQPPPPPPAAPQAIEPPQPVQVEPVQVEPIQATPVEELRKPDTTA
ncbi:MAG: Sec-independent protein translocase subunit TatA [Nocardioidaceae bacterium]